jgi:hypothetical protein
MVTFPNLHPTEISPVVIGVTFVLLLLRSPFEYRCLGTLPADTGLVPGS